MHYKNGREAHNGDKIVHFPTHGGVPTGGILYDAVPGNNFCNGKVATISPNDWSRNLRECLHADDVVAAVVASGVVFDNKDEPKPTA